MSTAAVEALRERLGPPVPGFGGARELLPVRAPLDTLFPGGGLARGSVVSVEGSVWLALAVAAGASAAGSWCAVVGMPRLGPAAAAETGVDLTRLVLVPSPGDQWATAVAALLDGVDVVIARPPRDVKAGEARRLAARARERRTTLLTLGPWPEAPDLRLRVDGSEWVGLHRGYGRISGRRCRVAALGRGAAARERRVDATLPELGTPRASAAATPVARGVPHRVPPARGA